MKQDSTLNYYNQNADAFIQNTIAVNFNETQDRFLSKLSQISHILDFGCGSGRDTKYFLEAGMEVTAIDGSKELCKAASEYTGIHVKQLLFQDLSDVNTYDGIWACASILHLPKNELKSVFQKMVTALKSDGIIYTSFKYGTAEGVRNGRYFTDFTEDTFKAFIDDIKGVTIEECWITEDVRPDRNEKWLNLILRGEQQCKTTKS